MISTARPEMRASPLVTCLSSVALCSASLGSRRRSAAFLEPCIMPSHSSSRANRGSMPLMRGEPSARRVASRPRPVAAKPLRANASVAAVRICSRRWARGKRRDGSGLSVTTTVLRLIVTVYTGVYLSPCITSS